MLKTLSIWSGRLLTLVFPAAMVACLFSPSKALAAKEIALGRDGGGSSEGDPLDTNDCGGGGSGSDIRDDAGFGGSWDSLVFQFENKQVLLVPEFQGGTLIFRIILVDKTDSGVNVLGGEGYHAP